jgi:transposase-like protein
LKQSIKTALETAVDEKITEHLSRVKHEKTKDGCAQNARNGTASKTVTTDAVGTSADYGASCCSRDC